MVVRRGLAVSHGIAIGKALVIGRWELDVPHYRVAEEEVGREVRRFAAARRQARGEIEQLRDDTGKKLGKKYAAIFDAHLMILEDRKLVRETLAGVREHRMNSEWALAKVVQELLVAFDKIEDPYLRERGGDIADVHQRLQRIFSAQANRHAKQLNLTEDTVVVAHTLLPSDAAWLHQEKVVAFVTEEGGKTSHTAILANALEIPAVLGVEGITGEVEHGNEVVVDGFHGKVVVSPADEVREQFLLEREELGRLERVFEEDRGPVETRDGLALKVAGNIEFPDEMKTLVRVGADGVGLYRSEFLFLATAPNLPTEEDHYEAYRKIASSAEGERVVIRTLDLGGEKYFHQVLAKGEANPVMGLRGARFCLARPDIFRTQLRGLLRVAAEIGNVWILVPMISSMEEWREVLSFFDKVKAELLDEGIKVADVPLGPMIEVPSAALCASALASDSDFMAIGTNDLLQYTLAVDRGNRAVAYLHNPWHPAVLRLIRETILAGRRAEIPVSLCGEMASDPLGALSLLGMGLTSFSCNPVVLPEIRSLLRGASEKQAREVMHKAIGLGDGSAIRSFVKEQFTPLITEILGEDLAGSLDEA